MMDLVIMDEKVQKLFVTVEDVLEKERRHSVDQTFAARDLSAKSYWLNRNNRILDALDALGKIKGLIRMEL